MEPTRSSLQIEDFLPDYPEIAQRDFYRQINLKQEFRMLQLPALEERPEAGLMLHQQFMARFFSPYTLYDRCLVFHELGTGKTCAAIAVAEHLKTIGANDILPRRALILVRGPVVAASFVDQLVKHCTLGQYLPNDWEDITQDTKKRRINKLVRAYYDINTFDTFSRHLARNSDKVISANYSNRLIIIDEAHNLHSDRDMDRDEKGDEKSNKETIKLRYTQISRLLHLAQNARTILLTGTPMTDKPSEIGSLFNLLLPLDKQLPTGHPFIQRYYQEGPSEQGDSVIINRAELEEAFRGRVSYVRSMINPESGARIDEGELIGPIHVVHDPMGSYQNEVYQIARSKDKGGMVGLSPNAREAAVFVFPDGTWGKEGFNNNINVSEQRTMVGKRIRVTTRYSLTPACRRELVGHNERATIRNIRNFSSKYASIIKNILAHPRELVFVYSEFVHGGNTILFAELMKLVGFGPYTGRQIGRRSFALISSSTSTETQRQHYIDVFDSKENAHGELIQVLIGSPIIGEGTNLYNVRHVHIVTPHFNNSRTEQAIGRAIRVFSHRDLPPEERDIRVYRHAATSEDFETIDVHMYELSGTKDVRIKHMERVLKESAVDCWLNRERNQRDTDPDYSRACDYLKCRYPCHGVPRPQDPIDTVGYYNYYGDEIITDLIRQLQILFHQYTQLLLPQIITMTPSDPIFLLRALENMIRNNIIVADRYGLPSYLREENNLYFLTHDPAATSANLSYYTLHPEIQYGVPYTASRHILEIHRDQKIIKRVCQKLRRGEEDVSELTEMSRPSQEHFLELLMISYGAPKSWPRALYHHFKPHLRHTKEFRISTLMGVGQERCFDGELWMDCPKAVGKKIATIAPEEVARLEQSDLGLYGIMEKGKFKVRDMKARNVGSGIVCPTAYKARIIHWACRLGLRTVPGERYTSRKTLLNILQTLNVKAGYTEEELTTLSLDDLHLILDWMKHDRPFICAQIKKYFDKQELMLPE